MLSSLILADLVTWFEIVIKACAYGLALLACGGVINLALLKELSRLGQGALRMISIWATIAGALFAILRIPIRSSFLMGGTVEGAFDPMMLGVVLDSPLGHSVLVRCLGLAIIFVGLSLRTQRMMWVSYIGVALTAYSFSLRGHAVGQGQALEQLLLMAHILALAFWVGGFGPLVRTARYEGAEQAGKLAQTFGKYALWAVGIVVLAGASLLVSFVTPSLQVIFTSYGQFFGAKLAFFGMVLLIAAVNKLALTPALLDGRENACARLRLSVLIEAAAISMALLTTSALTSLSAPSP